MKERESKPIVFILNGYEVIRVVFKYIRISDKKVKLADTCIMNGEEILYDDFMTMYAPSFFQPIDARLHAISQTERRFICNDNHFKRYPSQRTDITYNQNQRQYEYREN